MTYEIAFCDDSPLAEKRFLPKITAAFKDYASNIHVLSFSDPRRLLRYILDGNAFDILFLDIDMPGVDGISLCRRLQEQGYLIPVIFLSSMEDRVFETLEFRPIYFLRKRHFDEEIENVVKMIFQRASHKQEAVVFSDGVHSYRMAVHAIKYVEITNQTLSIYKGGDVISLRYKMGNAEKMLAPYGFMRVHKGYLVNYRYINCIQREEICLTDGKQIPMSRRRYQAVKEQFLRLTSDEIRNGDHI